MAFFTRTSNRIILALALATAAGASQQALAQADNPGPGGAVPTTPPPTAVPLDGGASLLLAGGVAYGLRQLRQRRKK
ncbi:MAG: PID-CTERM protein-sorting domain-containing protein [Janthinobacterium lividum]